MCSLGCVGWVQKGLLRLNDGEQTSFASGLELSALGQTCTACDSEVILGQWVPIGKIVSMRELLAGNCMGFCRIFTMHRLFTQKEDGDLGSV